MGTIVKLDSVQDYNELLGVETLTYMPMTVDSATVKLLSLQEAAPVNPNPVTDQ